MNPHQPIAGGSAKMNNKPNQIIPYFQMQENDRRGMRALLPRLPWQTHVMG
jgi:hypothetical protein